MLIIIIFIKYVSAVEKAQQWVQASQLPNNWNREDLLGPIADDASEDFDDDEQSEENDRFVAQLYKFMDDRCKKTCFVFL